MSAPLPFVALIPARLASTRLPNKPLAQIAGKPMVVHVAQRARESGAARVAVATDSVEIARAVEAAGVEAVMTSADHPSGTDRLAQAAELMGLSPQTIVANVQGDEPQMPPALVSRVASALAQAPDCVMSTAAHAISDLADLLNPNVVKVVLDRRQRAMYFSRAPIPFERDTLGHRDAPSQGTVPAATAAAGLPLRHLGLYAYRVSFLAAYRALERSPLEGIEALEQLRVLWHGERIAVVVAEQAPPAGVDTADDLARVRRAFGG